MAISIQTNVSSLIAQNNLRLNTNFQGKTIQALTSGYRINSSGDDAAGLAVANTLRGRTAELTQGVRNANDGISQFQIIDGGLNDISQILDRLRTLATQSASSTFTGNRATLDNEYQTLVKEIDRQASNINLNAGGSFNTKLTVYTGGGSTQSNAQISVDLSGAVNAVDSTGLGISGSGVGGGGTELTGNTVNLSNTAVQFLAGSNTQDFTFHLTGTGGNNQDVTITLNGGTGGLTGSQVVSTLTNQLQTYGISASIASDGKLEFSGSTAFSVSVAAATGGNAAVTTNSTAVNTSNYNLNSTFAAVTAGTETFTVQTGSGAYNVSLDSTAGASTASALTAINTALSGSGVYAVKGTNGTDIQLQSANVFSVNETALGTGGAFTALGAQAVTAPAASASNTANALTALTSLATAISNLGNVQGRVGAGENKLNYAVNLAQSQISSFSAAESQIRDADVAAEAANLTKAQVLQQSSIAALAQANSAPQAILSLLRGQ